MKGNTYQNFRRMFIEGCLRNTMRDYTKEEILRELNEAIEKDYAGKSISPRTFEIDWKFIKEELEASGFQLKAWKAGKQYFYKYSNPEFTIFSDIKKSELEKLSGAVYLLKQIKGIDLNDELVEVMQKLDMQIKYHYNKDKFPLSLQHETSKGYEYIDDLYDAIINETVIEFVYKPFTGDTKKVCIHPYHLKLYNNRWFLFGLDELHNKISAIALDRMQGKIKPLNKLYYSPDGLFNPKEYFNDIIGVTKYADKPVEEIILEFSSKRAPYVLTKPLHNSQELLEENEDGSILIKLKLIPNPELESLILSFGKDVKVLQPELLFEEIKRQVKESWCNYNSYNS